MRTRSVNCCTRTVARIVISVCVNGGYTLYHVAPLSAILMFFDTHCISFELIDRFDTNYHIRSNVDYWWVVLYSIYLKYGFRIRRSFEIRSTVLLTSSVEYELSSGMW